MLAPLDLGGDQRRSPLASASPVLKLAVAFGWLVILAVTRDARIPLVLGGVALGAAIGAGAVPLRRLAVGVAPLLLAAAGIVVANTLFSGANADPAAALALAIGPIRVTVPAVQAGLVVGARVVGIVAIGAAFAQTTDPTHLVDALVQQARVSPRFAYGALAAYGAAPRLASDLSAIRDARRVRGLRLGWHPGILVGLLVRAIRHADQLAMAMDARGFGSGPRRAYRAVQWRRVDLVIAIAGVVFPLAAIAVWG
jgi:energy-coupling factor transport system permease protein